MFKKLIISVGLLLLTLAACSSGSQNITPTQAPTQVPPTATAQQPAAVPPPTDELRQLRANAWQWVSLTTPQETVTIDEPTKYRVTFNSDASLVVAADCNTANGSYQGESGQLTLEIEAQTKAACPPGSRSDQFITLLGSGARYHFADGKLYIDLKADGGTLVLEPAQQPAAVPPPTDELRQLRANPWQWVSLMTPQETVTIDEPTKYRVTFNSDASLVVAADCNTANGSYQGESGQLTIEIETQTKAACPPGSRSDQFITLLGSGALYHFADGKLYIDLKADGGTLVLEPAQPATASAAIKAVPFDLGQSVVVQPWVSSEKMRDLPVELNGLIAVPPTGQQHPLAVIIHGSHEIGCPSPDGYTAEWPCPDKEVPNYQGFAYLLEALAARGYVAISLNANPAYVSAFGISAPNDRLPLLVDQYLQKIAAASNGEDVGLGVDLKDRIDWQQIVVLGHSAGGEGVNWIINSHAERTAPEQIKAGLGPIAAAVLLAPSSTQLLDKETGLPLAVILPGCDRDVSDLSGQKFYEAARRQTQRATLATSIYLPGMNHNRFNTMLGDDTLGNTSSVCDNALTPAAAQQQFLADYVSHFFDVALGRSTDEAAAGLDPTQPAPAKLFDRAVLTSLALPTDRRLRLPLQDVKATGAATAMWCTAGIAAQGEQPEVCRRYNYNQPGDPEEVALAWQGSNSVFEVALPQASRNLTDYALLHLRAAVDPINPLNPPDQPQALSVRLTDGAGKTAVVVLKDEPALAFPAGKKYFDDNMKLDKWDNSVLLSSIRVPLVKFSGVDLSDIRSVALVLDQTDQGSIFVTDVEFLKANP